MTSGLPPRAPIFVGGTGRSGTSITAELIGHHQDIALIPVEIRMHVDAGGLPDVLSGQLDSTTFERFVWRRWYLRGDRTRAWSGSWGGRGLHMIITGADLDRALHRFVRTTTPGEVVSASRQLLREILDPVADRAQRSRWVEMSPPNLSRATTLLQLFPDARFVHVVRDGRDVAASVVPLAWGPDEHIEALDWWASAVRQINQELADVPEEQVITVSLESLTGPTATNELERLVRFLGTTEEPDMVRFLRTELRTDRAHHGRWRRDLPRERQSDFASRYRTILEAMREAGLTHLPSG